MMSGPQLGMVFSTKQVVVMDKWMFLGQGVAGMRMPHARHALLRTHVMHALLRTRQLHQSLSGKLFKNYNSHGEVC